MSAGVVYTITIIVLLGLIVCYAVVQIGYWRYQEGKRADQRIGEEIAIRRHESETTMQVQELTISALQQMLAAAASEQTADCWQNSSSGFIDVPLGSPSGSGKR